MVFTLGHLIESFTDHLRMLDRLGLIEWKRDGNARAIWPKGLKEIITAAIRAAAMDAI